MGDVKSVPVFIQPQLIVAQGPSAGGVVETPGSLSPPGPSQRSRERARSLARRSRSSNGDSPQRVSMNLRMETVSYSVWSTNPCFANGEMMTVGTRSPGPQRSMTGGGT